jgi:hypothetical protein
MTPSQVRLRVAHGSPVLSADVIAATADTGGNLEARALLQAQLEEIAAARLEGDFETALRLAIQPNTNPTPKET